MEKNLAAEKHENTRTRANFTLQFYQQYFFEVPAEHVAIDNRIAKLAASSFEIQVLLAFSI